MEQKKRRTNGRHENLRGMLRSRGVQGLLATAAVFQALIVAERVEDRGDTRAEAAQAVRTAPALLEVLPPVAVTQLALDAPKEKAERAEESAEQKALALAEKYSRDGYRVSPELARDIHDAAVEHGIGLETAFGLVRAESGFRTSATSPVGAVGLTQLMPRTARWLEPGVTTRELRDPEKNLSIGFRYLKDLIEKYDGNERLALVAYHRGPGTVEIENARTGQMMPVGPAYWRDVTEHGARLDVTAAAARLTIPWLIVHGDADTSVPVDEGRALFDAAGEAAELLVVEGGDHGFGGRHPYAGATPELRMAAEATLDWFDEHLEP